MLLVVVTELLADGVLLPYVPSRVSDALPTEFQDTGTQPNCYKTNFENM